MRSIYDTFHRFGVQYQTLFLWHYICYRILRNLPWVKYCINAIHGINHLWHQSGFIQFRHVVLNKILANQTLPQTSSTGSTCPPFFRNVRQLSLVILHYNDFIMSAMASQITSLATVCSTVYSGADQRKHQSSASLVLWGAFTGDRWIPRTKAQ